MNLPATITNTNDLDDVFYPKHFLKQVVFRVDFNPILLLSQELSPTFQDSIRSGFPLLTPNQLHKYRTTIEKGTKKEDEHTTMGLWILSNTDKNIRIEICSEYIAFICTKYSKFDDLKQQIMEVYNSFANEYAPLSLTRVGLRYINEISISQGNPFDWKEYINPELTSLIDRFFEDKTELARSMNQTVLNKDNHLINFTFGIFNSLFPSKISKKEFILDYDSYTENTVDNEIEGWLGLFHQEIQTLFEKSIQEELRKLMRE